jgi:hypothetical protein
MNGLGILTKARMKHTDSQGIPYKIVNGRRYYNPGTIAQQGCRYLDAYVRTGDAAYLRLAQLRANRLRQLAFSRRGALWFGYAFNWPNEGLKAPWVSALAQGFALSFFVRLYRVTGRASDLATARSVFMSFRALGRARPWVAYVDSAHFLRLEEYPSSRPSHVLNGSNFAFYGLYDYAELTGDPTAVAMVRGHLTALRRYLVQYRVPGHLSYYDLRHRTQSAHYHLVHITQLGYLGRMGGGPWFTTMAARFKADHR